jgi:hypothetical protein
MYVHPCGLLVQDWGIGRELADLCLFGRVYSCKDVIVSMCVCMCVSARMAVSTGGGASDGDQLDFLSEEHVRVALMFNCWRHASARKCALHHVQAHQQDGA